MKNLQLALAALLTLSVPVFAQNHGGHPPIPSRGPAPVRQAPAAPARNENPPQAPRNYSDQPGHPNVPHVDNGRN